jgi:hypothetical protein
MFNLVLGYLLVAQVGAFDLRKAKHVLALAVGILAMAVMLARTFGKWQHGLESATLRPLTLPSASGYG